MLKTVQSALSRQSWFPVLLARLSVGWVMIESGWGKFHNLPKVTEFFESLGIPGAHLQAPLVAGVECVGGLMFAAGFAARLISIPLACTMVVAILTAKRADISSAGDLFGMEEYLFILIFLWVLFSGPGRASLDAVIARRLRKT